MRLASRFLRAAVVRSWLTSCEPLFAQANVPRGLGAGLGDRADRLRHILNLQRVIARPGQPPRPAAAAAAAAAPLPPQLAPPQQLLDNGPQQQPPPRLRAHLNAGGFVRRAAPVHNAAARAALEALEQEQDEREAARRGLEEDLANYRHLRAVRRRV